MSPEVTGWMFYHGYSRDSPSQQVEEGLEGIAGRELACKPAKRRVCLNAHRYNLCKRERVWLLLVLFTEVTHHADVNHM